MDRFYNSLDYAAAEGKEIIVNGDFNCDYLSKKPSLETKKLKEIWKSFGLTQLINDPTRTTSTTATLIDLFAYYEIYETFIEPQLLNPVWAIMIC